ncbi:LysR family transcriptional regulator [Novosphingobium flavum]|uniref:LysR family transcriptional regulator n=1 Tax=Novosphingobium flavum TaxID=1778672 RepID=A0A7X1FTZ1_9SPHN|nr:LysR family transcriptional regulator [Novosphingobium flavum]MBC2666923.1 LysR family transcriptional regulator [Novosphingobium flavum]
MIRDIRSLDLNLLKALDALLIECNATRAAERLGLTQPAVSGLLARLRDAFGDPLFVRGQRGMLPTERALQLAGPVRQVLEAAEALLQRPAFVPAEADMTLTLAATDYALQAVVAPFLVRLRVEAPGIRVAALAADSLALQARFDTGDLDLALTTPQTALPALHARTLFEEDYVVALREDHPDAAAPLGLDRYCALDHALVSLAGGGFAGVADAALAGLGRSRRVVLSVSSFLVLAGILRSTDLIATVPRRLLRDMPGLAIRPLPLPVPGFTKIAVWHERTHRDEGHRWLRGLLFETARAA